MKLEDCTDISDSLGVGIYVLLRAGKVVFVGRSTRGMLTKLAAHRSPDRSRLLPLPSMKFDQILVKAVHPDRLNSVYYGLIAEHRPEYNQVPTQPTHVAIERRL